MASVSSFVPPPLAPKSLTFATGTLLTKKSMLTPKPTGDDPARTSLVARRWHRISSAALASRATALTRDVLIEARTSRTIIDSPVVLLDREDTPATPWTSDATMRLPVALVRILILLLILRVVAAPLTIRPGKSGHNSTVVRRVSSWPLQRLQRFSSTSHLLELFEGRNKAGREGEGRRLSVRSLWPDTRTPLPSDLDHPRGSPAPRSDDRLRC
jgi:hypothetical protein